MTVDRRFTLIDCGAEQQDSALARAVETGLTNSPKQLPCRFFYDREGSLLFEAICRLPEYYLTRVETRILQDRAAELAARLPEEIALVELGSGSSAKTRILLETFSRGRGTLRYIPVDISRAMLEESCRALLRDFPALEILAVAGEYQQGLHRLKDEADRRKLVLWLGSNLGNLDREEAAGFLRQIREDLSSRDRLLVGVDLRKDRAVLEAAYDDSQGITAQFNRNILARINRELGADFDLPCFAHRAVYQEAEGRIEIYLVSSRSQRVRIDRLALEVPFAEGEAIHTENSYKYSLEEIRDLAAAAGLRIEQQWLDGDSLFSVNLLAPLPSPG